MRTLTQQLWQQMRREWTLQIRQKKSWVNSLLFFAMILLFFPMTIPADPQLDRIIVPGLVWVALLLANLLAAERLFQVDYDEGVIELWLVSGQPLPVMICAKVFVHWGLTLVPLLGLIPVVALLFHLPLYAALALAGSLLCGTLPVILLSALAAAYSTMLPQKGVLMGLVVLPLLLPILILGAATTTAAMAALPVSAYLAYLAALSCLSLATIPVAIAAVMRP
ncbi:MAG: heme exporter protein CcmB [Legionellales bacterium]|nr:heme exporter protein CcmB [Legionellales bacterium]